MKHGHIATLALLGALLSVPLQAQPGPGGGGMGPGGGPGMGMRFNQDNTRGWALMSAEERAAHRDRMLAAKSYEECKTLQDEHHKAMEARAMEKGAKLPALRQNGCDRMQARGFFK